jgi:transposase-like protein
LNAELSDHLGYEKGNPKGQKTGNSPNGHGSKRLTSEDGEMETSSQPCSKTAFHLQYIEDGKYMNRSLTRKI